MNIVFTVSAENMAGINHSSFGNLLASLNGIFDVINSPSQKETKPVQMMWQEETFDVAYVKEIQAQILVMPYRGMEMSFMVLLPDEGVDIRKVSQEIR